MTISIDTIIEKGKVVHASCWDSGAPGEGADCECIYKLKGQYYGITSNRDLYGPYPTLGDALQQEEFGSVGAATTDITCTELTPDELVPLLRISGHKEVKLTINDEPWLVTAAGEFRRLTFQEARKRPGRFNLANQEIG